MSRATTATRAVRRLALAHGIQTAYYDVDRVRRHASPEALTAVLRALGVPIARLEDALDAQRLHDDAAAAARIAPVHVAWEGELPPLRLSGGRAFDRLSCRLVAEDGTSHEWRGRPKRARAAGPQTGWRTGLPRRLPLGYHRLEVRSGREVLHTRIIAAPRRAFLPPDRRMWGVFLPLYALRGAHDHGVGDYADLAELARWTGDLGGHFVGTLPLLAAFLSSPFEPSPYAPASRLFWNDLFIDPHRLPADDSGHAHTRPAAARTGDLVDYRAVAARKRAIIAAAAQRFFRAPARARSELRAFLDGHPHARDYARFRAVCDARAEGWPAWPDRLRERDIREGDFDLADYHYHLYAAWVADRQLANLAVARQDGAAALYLDLPIGVHRDGYDTWRMPHLFALDVSAGAPPDTFFRTGQDWGFPPLNPEALRADGHEYFIACVRHHLRHAGALRLDHVMALQRLFWIPRGFEPAQGVYVRYPLDELFGVLTLESVRHHAIIIGEDLGTVSREIRSAMNRHRVQRMFVLQFEAAPDRPAAVPDPPSAVIASLNTHDMPTFAAYWDALDVDDRRDLGLLTDEEARRERADRARLRARVARQLRAPPVGADDAPAPAVLVLLLERLAASDARILLINLEDLWLETRPQNVPGTSAERPNWRRRALWDLARIRRSREVIDMLERIARLRDHTEDHA